MFRADAQSSELCGGVKKRAAVWWVALILDEAQDLFGAIC
jgi:hypothetical protein